MNGIERLACVSLLFKRVAMALAYRRGAVQ